LIKLAATPLFNLALKKTVNAPAEVKHVEVSWSFLNYQIKELQIDNPPGFKKGKLLSVEETDINIQPKTLYTFKPYLNVDIKNLYFYFQRKEDNSTNIAVAFNLPYQKGKVSPLEFTIHNTNATIEVQTLENVDYKAHGYFKGFYNNAEFIVEGKGNFSNPHNPETLTDFTVYNWKVKNNPIFQQLAVLLNRPDLAEPVFSKIVGTVQTKGDLIILQGVKFYIVNNLFMEIYKGSTINRKTKELHIEGALYLPAKVEFVITGTTERPSIEIKNLSEVFKQFNNIKKKTSEYQEKLNEFKEQLKQETKQLEEQIKKITLNIGNETNQTIEILHQKVKQIEKQLQDMTNNSTQQVQQQLEQVKEQLKNQTEELKKQLEEFLPIKLP
jgi:gas vesicle protein